MSSQPARSYTRLAVSIVVAAVIVSASILAYPSFQTTVTKTLTVDGTSQLYQVEFVQESSCPYGSWLFPWGVMLGSQTVVQPSNATLPLSYSESHLTSNSSYSTIWFSLPNGTYSYTIIPNDPTGSAQSGNVTVDGTSVVVQVYAFVVSIGCSSSTSSTASTEVTNGNFSFSPPSPVRIDNVQALVQLNQEGPDPVTFTVAFTNVGTSPITVVGACFSPLAVSPPANSTVVQTATGSFVQCEAITCNTINPGQSSEASTDPHLVLVRPGTVTMMLTLYWGTDDSSCTGPNGGPDSTSISASFFFD
jgi:hypothetical protein